MNELTLSNDISRIEVEIDFYKNQAGQSVWEIGRRLNHVKENDLVHGEFGPWLKKINISHDQANKMMAIFRELNSESTRNLGIEALYLITTLPEKEKEAEIKKAEEGDPSTTRELKKLKKEIKQKDDQLEQARESERIAIEKLEREQAKPAETIIQEVEVVPDDYQLLKQQNQSLHQAVERLSQDVKQLEEDLSKQDEHSKKYEELNRQLKEMNGQLTEGQKRIQAQKDIYRFTEESNQAIDKLSTLIYLVNEKEMSINEYAREPIEKIIDDLEDICHRLKQKINQTNIIEGEIIHG